MVYLPENIHKICLESIPIVSVDIVILDDTKEKTLLFKRKNNPLKGIFYTIGGRVLKNESLIDTALRKLKDEAGIEASNNELSLAGFMEEFYEKSVYKDVDTHNVNIFFWYIALTKLDIKTDSQHDKFKWFDVNSRNLHPHVLYKLDLIYNCDNRFACFAKKLESNGKN
jgi:colanic acid biosynthesis protein WcaH